MIVALLAATALCAAAPALPPAVRVAPFLQQSAGLFTSARVTAGGVGGAFGAQLVWRERFLAQGDVGWLWGAGNAVLTRLAFGVQRQGFWSPAIWATLNGLWAERLEILADDGRRPEGPVLAFGLRASPLRFAGAAGLVSALELGAAVGASGGTWLEVTAFQVGVRW